MVQITALLKLKMVEIVGIVHMKTKIARRSLHLFNLQMRTMDGLSIIMVKYYILIMAANLGKFSIHGILVEQHLCP